MSTGEQDDGGTDGGIIEDVECPACDSESFHLKTVDEWGNGDLAVYVFCADCGNSTGKMHQRTVDNRITDSGDTEENGR
jgi:hypothetical protein